MSGFLNIDQNILSWVLFLPLIGSALIFAAPTNASRPVALLIALADFALSIYLPMYFQGDSSALQFVERHPWIPDLGIQYALGIDGISLWLVLLTTFLGPLVVLSAWKSVKKHEKGFFALLLMLQSGMLGAFMATDLVLFYIFWEAMLIPMYLLIGVWGGERRIYATMKFFIFTMAGSLLMLVGLVATIVLYQRATGVYSTDMRSLYDLAWGLNLSAAYQIPLFFAFAFSFAIKVPMFTLHTWLPDAHVEAPTAGSVVLAGVLLKMGTYGFMRIAMPMFPRGLEFFTPLLLTLSAIGIVYGALVAMVQPDIKKLVAYSSISHLGYCMLGLLVLNMQGVQGSLYQMLNHGISTGGLFLVVGMLYDRRHTREIKEYGGIAKSVPLLSAAFLLITLSSIGLPGTNGFVGEFLILLGAFRTQKILAVIGGSGIVLGAVYMLWMYQRVVMGPIQQKNRALDDLNWREGLVLVPIIAMILFMGIFPGFFLRASDATVRLLLLGARGQIQAVK